VPVTAERKTGYSNAQHGETHGSTNRGCPANGVPIPHTGDREKNMSKHKAQKPTTNWRAWRQYIKYLALAYLVALYQAHNKRTTKHNKHNSKK
jgi:hypothetical protein